MKTFKNWEDDIEDYLTVGDEVDEEMVDHFLNILPPRTFEAYIVQCGEIADHYKGKATYLTFSKQSGRWIYCGHCYGGEIKLPA